MEETYLPPSLPSPHRRMFGLPSSLFQDFTLDMYFRQFWRDPRLAFERRPNLDKLVVGAEYIKLIWVPDTFFVNEKTAYFHQATADNQFVRIFHSGEILRSIRWVLLNNKMAVE